MNETLKAIAARYSCREYLDKPVEKDKLRAIAEAAVQSPSAMNNQPWHIAVITDKNLIKELDEEGLKIIADRDDKSMYEVIKARNSSICCDAPCVIMIPIKDGAGMDCGVVCQSITIAATSLGLGSLICWQAGIAFSGDRGSELMQKIGFPEGYEFGMAVLVGYEATKGKPHEPDLSKISYVE